MVFHTPTYLCLANEHGMGQSATVLVTETGHEILTTGIEDGPFLYD
jgi:Xaa-Pro aminopeptidase